jgi:hypothetical protein
VGNKKNRLSINACFLNAHVPSKLGNKISRFYLQDSGRRKKTPEKQS